jgi:SAM-dependent methyltransferase
MNNIDQFIKDKLNKMASCKRVYDIGGGSKSRYRQLFKEYIVVDVNPHYKPDIVGDIQDLPFNNNSIECVLCFSVFEHVENPILAAEELYRVLKPGGKALLSIPFIWPYHGNKFYRDFWRFTEDGLRILFKKFSLVEVMPGGGYFSVMVNLIPSYTKIDRFFRPLAKFLDSKLSGKFFKNRRNITEFFVFLEK